jgi:hypothetical protein
MRSTFAVLLGSLCCGVLGCTITVAQPPGFSQRETMEEHHVTAAAGAIYGSSPRSFDSSLGRVEIEAMPDPATSGRLTKVTFTESAIPGKLACAQEPMGAPYPDGFTIQGDIAFACVGTVGGQEITFGVARNCREGSMTIGETRYHLIRGEVALGNASAPTNQATLLDEHATPIAIFDSTVTQRLSVWTPRDMTGESAALQKEAIILTGTAFHDWTQTGHQRACK